MCVPSRKTSSRQPFTVEDVNTQDRTVRITIRGDCIGTIANHLKTCPRSRKSHKVVVRMGYELETAGNAIFQKGIRECQ
jgi:hypothetical protein